MKKNYRGITALILSASMTFTLMPGMSIRANDVGETFPFVKKTHDEVFNGKADQYKGKTVILHSNDVHGALAGYAYIAELEDDFEEAGAEVITMDAGDFSQGDPNISYSKGADAITLMNAAGYEYSTLGNHEFDYGYDQLKSNLKNAQFKVLCADVLEGDKPIYDKDEVYTTKSGVKIGIFGMETPEAASKSNPAYIKGLTFLNNTSGKTDLYDCAKAEVQTLKSAGANIIISLAHLGMDSESSQDGHRSCDMYKNVPGIDMILDGHSHDEMTKGPENEPIQSTGTKFANIGVVVIDDASKKITDNYLVATEGLDKDPEVEAAAKAIIDKVDKELGAPFAKSKVVFASQKRENRCYETNTGDLVTDAMLWKILKNKNSLKVPDENIVAVINGGGIRAGLNIGDVSQKDIKAILPFGNTMDIVYVTGSTLLEVLEASTFNSPDAIGGYPQTKGIKFTIDTNKDYDKGEAYPNSTYYKPNSIQRVNILSINGKAFDENATYAVVTNDFCSAGGDTYYSFKVSDGITELGFPVDEVVSDYITNGLNGILSAKRYATSRGDAIILPVKDRYDYAALDGASVKSLTTKKGTMTVTLKKSKEEIDGIEVTYSTKSSFTKSTAKTVKLGATKSKTTVKSLKKGTKYYVKVRTFATIAGKKVYSKWSKAKSIKIK